jgi:hypothetical protein
MMSILGQLKKINAGQTAQLYARHPLRDDAPDARLRYLSAVALACAPDRAPLDIERKAFFALGESLGLDAQETAEQLDERASVQEDDIRRLFASIRERNLRWLYLVDVSWLHLADGNLDAAEAEMANELALLLDVDRSRLALLHRLLAAVRDRDPRTLAGELPAWLKDPELQHHLPHVVRRCMPFVHLLAQRWIDHGDGSITDVRTALRWQRGPMFSASIHPDRPGVTPIRFSAGAEGEAVVSALTVRPCEEVKSGDLLARLDTPAGPQEIRATGPGCVMEFLVQVGDRIRPGAEIMLLAKPEGPTVLSMSLPEDGAPKDIHLHRIQRAIERVNAKEPPPGMSPWRLPSHAELDAITEAPGSKILSIGINFGAITRDFSPGIFMGLKERKLWCQKENAEGSALSLEQLSVFNAREKDDPVLLLCRSPLDTGSAA